MPEWLTDRGRTRAAHRKGENIHTALENSTRVALATAADPPTVALDAIAPALSEDVFKTFSGHCRRKKCPLPCGKRAYGW